MVTLESLLLAYPFIFMVHLKKKKQVEITFENGNTELNMVYVQRHNYIITDLYVKTPTKNNK